MITHCGWTRTGKHDTYLGGSGHKKGKRKSLFHIDSKIEQVAKFNLRLTVMIRRMNWGYMKRFDLCVCSTTTFFKGVELVVDEIRFSSSLKCFFVVVDRFVQYYIMQFIQNVAQTKKKSNLIRKTNTKRRFNEKEKAFYFD